MGLRRFKDLDTQFGDLGFGITSLRCKNHPRLGGFAGRNEKEHALAAQLDTLLMWKGLCTGSGLTCNYLMTMHIPPITAAFMRLRTIITYIFNINK